MKLSFVLIVLFFLLSCSSHSLENDYKQLKSSRIVFPNYEYVIKNGREIVTPSKLNSTKLKLIVFCDSTNCNKCSIENIYSWERLIEYAKTLNNELSYHFIYYPKESDIEDVRLTLTLMAFDYPIILDSLGKFRALNPHIPTNSLFHTFLVNEKGNVIMVGNPLSNTETYTLFKKTVEDYLSNGSKNGF